MLAIATTTTMFGLEPQLVRVEVECMRGIGAFDLAGLAEASVRESRIRVRSALAQLGLTLDEFRIVVNLAPGDLKKNGSGFDLAIAVATLAALGQIESSALQDTIFLGELSLGGELLPIRGVLPKVLFARGEKMGSVIVPQENAAEAAVVHGIASFGACDLREVIDHLRNHQLLPPASRRSLPPFSINVPDLADVRGQPTARRALEIAAAGHHHVLMIGPPGGGKSMLAQRMPGLLPDMSPEEALEVSAIHSVAGLLPRDCGLLRTRPYRAPHHSVSDAGLVGGGYPPRPGEISLAHHGVLFLDEFTEFRRTALESLRQPIEDGTLTISRANGSASFPAKPLLVAACNPCPCGYSGDGTGRCLCSTDRVRKYRSRLSGPILDRIELHIYLPTVDINALFSNERGEPTASVKKRVQKAADIQRERSRKKLVTSQTNAHLTVADLDVVCPLDHRAENLLATAVNRWTLSARSVGKIRRVARTIADLDAKEVVTSTHIGEAISLHGGTTNLGPPNVENQNSHSYA